jgi:hypothetical protein
VRDVKIIKNSEAVYAKINYLCCSKRRRKNYEKCECVKKICENAIHAVNVSWFFTFVISLFDSVFLRLCKKKQNLAS